MFNPDRQQLRQRFVDAWRRHRCGETLEPLERQIADLIAEHPEYHRLLEQADSGQTLLEEPATDTENPFLHLALHLALREQVGTDRPTGIRNLTRSLLLQHGDGHAVEHRMMECLAECLWDAQQSGRPADDRAYLERLKALR